MTFQTPIPNITKPKYKPLNDFIDEDFILVEGSDFFIIAMDYYRQGIPNATDKCYMRKSVYDMLIQAARLLPNGYKFKIFDAWRPFAVQQWLFNHYKEMITERFSHLKGEELREKINSFVAIPVEDRESPPGHTTGGAVDLTIVDENGKELDMGSGFDEFSDVSTTIYFEDSDNEVAKNNRRFLYNIMTDVGFTNLPSEWWHFDYGDRTWALLKGERIKYKGAFTLDEVR